MEMKVTERMNAIREEAVSQMPVLENATQIGTATYIVATTNGYAKVAVSAIKDPEYNPDEVRANYVAHLEEVAEKARLKAEAKAAEEAKKAAKKAEKE